MAPRIYTSVVNVGGIAIYNVTSDPNGVLVAPLGSLAVRSDLAPGDVYQNSDGGTTWISIKGGGTVVSAPVFPLGETMATTDSPIVPIVSPPAVARTITFTAPEDLTIRNLVFYTNLTTGGPDNVVQNLCYGLSIGQLTVAGSGPDVGSYVDGFGIPGGLFSDFNLFNAPILNIRMAAGDTLTIPIYFIAGGDPVAYNAELLYTKGIDTGVKPKRFIGGPSAPMAAALFSGTDASGVITVNAAAGMTPGDIIEIENPYGGSGAQLDPAGGQLTGVAGARTSGSNDFDVTVAGAVALRDEILAALSDPANQWDADYTFVASGVSDITITRKSTGALGNTDSFTATLGVPADLTLVPGTGNLSGGDSPITAFTMASPSVDTTLESIAFLQGATLGILSPDFSFPVPIELTAFKVNTVADPTVPSKPANSNPNVANYISAAIPVLSGDTLEIEGRAPQTPGLALFVLIGTAT
jgi:hypothetical protein